MDIRLLAIAAVLPLAACMQERPPESTPTPPTEAMCNADSVQSLVGQTATGDVGAQLIKGSGATTLKSAPLSSVSVQPPPVRNAAVVLQSHH